MHRNIITALLFVLLLLNSLSFAQPQHTHLLYADPLDDPNSTALGQMINNGGAFLSGKGWEATTSSSQLKIILPADLPFEGTFAVEVTNFDPVSQNVPDTKQHIVNLYSQENGNKDIFHTDGSWFNIRTGTYYSDGPGMAGFKFLVAPRGIDTREEERCMQWATWDLNRTYEFRVIWTREYIYCLVDGVVQSQLPFHGQVEPFRYVFLGKDNIKYGYAAQPGVIFKNLRIYSAEVPPPPASFDFTDITSASHTPGYSANGYGKGVAFADANGDGTLDLFVTNAQSDVSHPDLLYMNQGANLFQEEASPRGTEDKGISHAVVSADLDNDGDLDVFFANMPGDNGNISGGNTFYLNDGNGNFVQKTDWSSNPSENNKTISAIAVDIDNDGDQDLYTVNWGAPNELYLNDGHGNMTLAQRGVEGPIGDASEKVGVTAGDVDGDGDIDIYVCRRDTTNWLFINDGTGHFSEQAAEHGVAISGRSHGAVFGDVDNDGDLDLFVVNYAYNTNELPLLGVFFNQGDGYFEDRSHDFNIQVSGYTLILVDVDNDADLDMYLVDNDDKSPGAKPRMYLNDGTGQFTRVSVPGLEVPAKDARGAAYGDIDGDGDVDFYIACSDGPNFMLRNDLNASNHYIDVLCVGPGGDYGGFGSKVSIYEAGHLGEVDYLLGYQESVSNTGYISQNQTALHFGLGDRTACDIRVEQVDGTTLDYSNIDADQTFDVSEQFRFKLQYVSGDSQSSYISTQLPQPLTVRVTDMSDVPQSSVTVTFVVTDGDGQIVETQPMTTDVDGLASVHVLLGSQADTLHVEARCSIAQGSPITFTLFSTIPPIRLAKEDGDGQLGIVGKQLNQAIVVKAFYASGIPVPQYAVTFSIKSGDGKVGEDTLATVMTDASGLASVTWTLGTSVGLQQLQATADDTVLTFSATAQPDHPVSMRTVSGDGQIYAPGQPFAEPFAVKIVDQYANPVAGHPVLFRVTSGGGHLQEGPEQTVPTDSTGIASVIWTTGPYLGPENSLQASSEWQGTPLDGSPIIWQLTGINVDPARSSISAISPVVADGVSQSDIVVALRNALGDPVGQGLTVRLEVSGTANALTMDDTLTNQNGEVYAHLSSHNAETKVIRARVMGLDLMLQDSAIVVFQAPAVPDSLILVAGANQTGVVGKPLSEPFVVRLLDNYQQPFPHQMVTFTTVQGGGNFQGQTKMDVETDSLGLAEARLTLGTKALLENVVQVTVPNSAVQAVLFTALAQADSAAQLKIVSGNNQSACFDQRLPEPLTVKVTDQYGNPKIHYPISFSVMRGQGHFSNGEDSVQIPTDSLGLASAFFTTGHQNSDIVIKANADFAEVRFDIFTPCSMVSDSLSTITATSPIFPNGMARSQITVVVKDESNNPIPGISVELTASGSGNTLVQPSAPTDSNGVATGYLSSTVAEDKVIRAVVLPDSIWLKHEADITFAYGRLVLEEISGNNQVGFIAQTFPNALIVRVLSDSVPVENYPVRFKIISGEGNFVFENNRVQEVVINTDSLGQAKAILVAGLKTGTINIQIIAEGAVNSPMIFSEYANTCCLNQLNKVSGDSQIVKPGQTLSKTLVVRKIDLFGNPAINSPVTFRALDGGQVLTPQPVMTDSSGYAACTVAVGVEERAYHFKAITEDIVSVTFVAFAHAQGGNHAPVITAYSPDSLSLSVHYGETLFFQISSVHDDDGDTLETIWKINGIVMGHQDHITLTINDTWPLENKITGIVSDGALADSIVWNVRIATLVEGKGTAIPSRVVLHQNYPNPFNPSTQITFELPRESFIVLEIYNLNGQRLASLLRGQMSAGVHQVVWDATDAQGHVAPSGIYYYSLRTGGQVYYKKLILMK